MQLIINNSKFSYLAKAWQAKPYATPVDVLSENKATTRVFVPLFGQELVVRKHKLVTEAPEGMRVVTRQRSVPTPVTVGRRSWFSRFISWLRGI